MSKTPKCLLRSSGRQLGTSLSPCFSTAGWRSVLWRTWLWVPQIMSLIVSRNDLFLNQNFNDKAHCVMLCCVIWQLSCHNHHIPLRLYADLHVPNHLNCGCKDTFFCSVWFGSDCVHPRGPPLEDNLEACRHFITLLCGTFSSAALLQQEASQSKTIIPSSFAMKSQINGVSDSGWWLTGCKLKSFVE